MKIHKKIIFISLSLILLISFCMLESVYIYSSALNSKIDVSVIVPVYNVEQYLDECLNSIENQTKTDGVEIICIDDGSKDNSAEILKRHAKKNNKIRIINQENKGVSVARNSGIENARGKYIMFVDSDDIIAPYAIEKAYNTAEEYNVDIVKFNSTSFRNNQKVDIEKYNYQDSKTIMCTRKENENPFEVWRKYRLLNVVWNKLWKKDFIQKNHLSFRENIKLEDVLFNWLAFPQITKMAVDNNIFYLYRKNRQGSIMYNLYRNLLDRIKNNLVIAEELVINRDFIKFDDSDNWIIKCIFSLCYNSISKNLKVAEKQKYYASKYLDIINSFIEKYNVKVSSENRNKMNVYSKLANMSLC